MKRKRSQSWSICWANRRALRRRTQKSQEAVEIQLFPGFYSIIAAGDSRFHKPERIWRFAGPLIQVDRSILPSVGRRFAVADIKISIVKGEEPRLPLPKFPAINTRGGIVQPIL